MFQLQNSRTTEIESFFFRFWYLMAISYSLWWCLYWQGQLLFNMEPADLIWRLYSSNRILWFLKKQVNLMKIARSPQLKNFWGGDDGYRLVMTSWQFVLSKDKNLPYYLTICNYNLCNSSHSVLVSRLEFCKRRISWGEVEAGNKSSAAVTRN